MSLYEESLKFRDRTGLVVPCDESGNPSTETGNNLYTWLLFIQLFKRRECTVDHIAEFKKLVETLWVRPFPEFTWRMIPGLMNRTAYKQSELQAPDDYIALMLASQMLNTSERTTILKYGIDGGTLYPKRWVYNNLEPGHWTGSAWFGRQGHVIAHFYHACEAKPGFLLSTWWALAIATSGISDKTGTTPRILGWLMIEAHINKNFLAEIAADSWYDRLNRDFPGGMKEVVGKHLGVDHPIAKYWVD